MTIVDEKDDHLLPYLGYVEWTTIVKEPGRCELPGRFHLRNSSISQVGMSPEIHQQGVEFSALVARQMVREIEKGMKEK